MTKVPLARSVKTRLQPFLSPDECAALAEAFLCDAARKAKKVSENVIVAFYPPGEFEKLKTILPDRFVFVSQIGNDLGARMINAFDFAFKNNFDSVVMIGTDSPTFPADFIEHAFGFLETESDAVLGKTADGGFYLIGLRVLRKEIFANVVWSSPQTFEHTRENIINLDLSLSETPESYDVDAPSDFNQLQNEFTSGENLSQLAPRTFKFLTEWKKLKFANF